MSESDSTPDLDRAAAAMRLLGSPMRWGIVQFLVQREACVTDLATALGVPSQVISKHLAHLRELGLVRARRDEPWTFYSLDPAAWRHLAQSVCWLATTPLAQLAAGTVPTAAVTQPWLTTAEAATSADVSRQIVRHWIRIGRLPSAKRTGSHRVDPEALARVQDAAHLGTLIPAWRRNPRFAGNQLRRLREDARLNQQELAANAGLTHEELSRIETGRKVPYPQTVRALATALRVDPVRFITEAPAGLTLLTVAEAAARLDVPRGRLQTWLKQGELPGHKVSGQWRVPAVAVAELERSGRLRGQSRRLDPRYRG